ncbi:MAG TPA: FAD-dependent oxidoreductase, partial [Candidatus Latescibacteria bacterium]|nr:FAD-dependent oxidoreductase [Candidatus Latescibacterota bacterium]
RCLYSRNIVNLFMAGRNISTTYWALGAVRVMRTCGLMGEVAGTAAAVCARHGCLPREVYKTYLGELKRLLGASST